MITRWTNNDTNTVFTANGEHGRYTITFIKFTDNGYQLWELCREQASISVRTDFSSLAGAKRRADEDDTPIL